MPALRFSALLALALTGLLFSGCGYVHFGRLTPTPATADAALAAENTSLRVEKKMLQQELALARKEGIALRDALERRAPEIPGAPGAAAGTQSGLALRLKETTEELTNLRAQYVRLEQERARQLIPGSSLSSIAAAEQIGDLKAALSATEEKLASALRTYTKLQQEIAGLRQQVDRERTENIRLAQQVSGLTTQNEQAVAALAQLNTELLAQREARQRAETEARAAQSQLQLVIARAGRSDDAASLADTRSSAAGSTSDLSPATLRLEAADPAETPADAVLRTSPERLRAAADKLAAEPAPRTYIVVEGDTLEGIAKKIYGKPERWRVIYAANNVLLRDGRPLRAGMQLEIPEE
jgi:phage tail protein X/cell division protein FtsB